MRSVFPQTRETFVLSNPHLPDCPMTHVSDGFLEVRCTRGWRRLFRARAKALP
jgi:hypothetical protein